MLARELLSPLAIEGQSVRTLRTGMQEPFRF